MIAQQYHQTYNFWSIYDPDTDRYGDQKVAFDPLAKIIYVNEDVTELDVKADLYSAWKEWIKGSPAAVIPAGQPPAFSAIGGDPISETQNLGTTYFLENDWRIQPFPKKTSYTLTINGNLYTREGDSPFLFAEGASVSLTRSNIVDLIRVEAVAVSLTEQDIANIATATATLTADQVWDEPVSDHQNAGSTGEKLRKGLSKTQYISRL